MLMDFFFSFLCWVFFFFLFSIHPAYIDFDSLMQQGAHGRSKRIQETTRKEVTYNLELLLLLVIIV
jgi:hypothetical protein